MPIGSPLSIESPPAEIASNNLSARFPQKLWDQLRARAIDICSEMCGICGADEVPLYLHERWQFFWDENDRPCQLLEGLILVCLNCKAVKNLEQTRKLASEGKLDIEPILQHFMKVNGVTRQKALRQWAAHRGRHDWDYKDEYLQHANWTEYTEAYDRFGIETGAYIALSEWIDNVTTNGAEAVNERLFYRIYHKAKTAKRTAEESRLDDALIAAIKASDASAVVSLLKQGADPNSPTEVDLYGFGFHQIPALMLAMSWFCRKDSSSGGLFGYAQEKFNEPLVRALIEGGASLRKFSEYDEPPLSKAIQLGEVLENRYDLTTFMLDHGADVNELHNGVLSALHEAIGTDDIKMVNLLLDRGAEINPQTGYDSPLMRAVHFKMKSMVEILLSRGADVHYCTRGGETAHSRAPWKRGVGKQIREMLEEAGA